MLLPIRMTFALLLEKLLQIESAAASGDAAITRVLTMEAEKILLQLQRDTIDGLQARHVG